MNPVGSHIVELITSEGTRRLEVASRLTVGRERGEILVPDATVSAEHLSLDGSGPVLTVTDLGSANGTYRGGERVGVDVPLAPGDELRFGNSVVRVIAAPAVAAHPLPPPVGPGAPAGARPVVGDDLGRVRNDAVEVQFERRTHGERIAREYAGAARRARTALAGFGSESWGTVPTLHLVDPFLDGGDLVSSGAVIAPGGSEAWVVVSPESSPEPPHRVLALMFGAAYPAAGELQLLIEGYGIHRSGTDSTDAELAGRPLPPLDAADGDLRAAMAVSFVRFLIAREGEDSFIRLLAAPAGRVDETVRDVYGPSMGQLEQLWRRTVMSGQPDVRTGEFLRMSLRYLRPYRLRQLEILGYMLLSLAFVASFPFVTRRLFDTALPSGEFSQVLTLLAVLGLSFVVSLVAGVRQAYQTAWVSNAVTRDIRQTIFGKVQDMPASWFAEHPQGDVLSRLFNDVGAVQSGMSQAIGQGVFQLVSLVTTAIIMLSINLWLGLVVLLAAPLVGVVYRRMSDGARLRSIAVQEQSSGLLSVAAENYRAIPVVKLFGLAERERRRFGQQSERLFRSTRRMSMWSGMFGLSVNLIVTLLRLAVLGLGAWLILEGHFTTGGLVAFLSIMGEVLSPVTILVSLSQEVQASMGSLVRINEVVDAPIEGGAAAADAAAPLPPLQRDVRLAGVGLSYDGTRRVLDDVDLSFPVGRRVAVVGPSGSGKSTVLRVLMRLHDPDEGTVLVDGVDVRNGSIRSWRDQLGVVFQDSFLFDATIRENIALGRIGATDAEIDAAARAAEVDGFVSTLPRGWDSLVGEGGSNLSGGQRQRVAIARALLRDPRLLLLDEATSALDPATERQINDTIRRIAAGRTVVAVTHRLASITDYDLIVVMVDGRVAEQGRHDELLARRGPYARLWAEQTGVPLPEPEVEPVDLVEAARRIPFLSGVDDDALRELVSSLPTFRVPVGRTVDEGDGVMILTDGAAEVLASLGGAAVGRLEPGDAFGVLATLGAPPLAVAVAVEDATFAHLSGAALGRFAAHHPEVAARLDPAPRPGASPRGTRVGRMTLARPSAAGVDPRRTMAVFAPPSAPN